MASTIFQMRIDEELKNRASTLYDNIGIDLPTAIRMFLKRSILVQGIPFDTKISNNNKGIEILNQINKQSKINKTDKLSLEEVNQEINNNRNSL